jgi:hypothetical protein
MLNSDIDILTNCLCIRQRAANVFKLQGLSKSVWLFAAQASGNLGFCNDTVD